MKLIDLDKAVSICDEDNNAVIFSNIKNVEVKAIPIEWLKNKKDELEKEYYDLFHAYTDESRNNQVQLLNDFHAFNTVLKYWEKENEIDRCR